MVIQEYSPPSVVFKIFMLTYVQSLKITVCHTKEASMAQSWNLLTVHSSLAGSQSDLISWQSGTDSLPVSPGR